MRCREPAYLAVKAGLSASRLEKDDAKKKAAFIVTVGGFVPSANDAAVGYVFENLASELK